MMGALRIILWIGTIVMMVILFQWAAPLREAGVKTIEHVEMSSEADAASIVASWKENDLVDTALRVIYADYLFILFYVPLMILCSRDQLKKETRGVWCMLLIANTPLALLTGILDLIENMMMTHNIVAMEDFTSTRIISIIKFAAAGWVVLVWLSAIVTRAFFRSTSH